MLSTYQNIWSNLFLFVGQHSTRNKFMPTNSIHRITESPVTDRSYSWDMCVQLNYFLSFLRNSIYFPRNNYFFKNYPLHFFFLMNPNIFLLVLNILSGTFICYRIVCLNFMQNSFFVPVFQPKLFEIYKSMIMFLLPL